jgi:hypothetical protein
MLCPRRMQAQPNGPDDFSLQLLHRACDFQNAEGIHDSLRHLYILLASDAISPRRAAVLGCLNSLLLRTLPAVSNDPNPLAGTLMSATQLAERDKAKSLPANPSRPPAPALTQKPTPAQKTLPAQQPAPTPKPTPTHNPLPTQGRALTNKIVPQPSAANAPTSRSFHTISRCRTHRRLPRLRPRPPPTRQPRRVRRPSSQSCRRHSANPNRNATNPTQIESDRHQPECHQPDCDRPCADQHHWCQPRSHTSQITNSPPCCENNNRTHHPNDKRGKPAHRKEKIPSQGPHKYARNRIRTAVGLDHRPLKSHNPNPKTICHALGASCCGLRVIFSIPHATNT